MGLSNKRQVFVEEYLKCWNATEAARRAGYRGKPNVAGARLIANDNIRAAIKQRLDALQMDSDEILAGLTEQARADLGVFFRIVEEWTYYPLPSYEVIDAKEIEILDEDGQPTGEKKISYWCKHVVIDLDKVIDPCYSHLIHKFTDSPKNGIGIELYNKQEAFKTLAKIRGMMKENIDLTSGGEKIIVTIKSDD